MKNMLQVLMKLLGKNESFCFSPKSVKKGIHHIITIGFVQRLSFLFAILFPGDGPQAKTCAQKCPAAQKSDIVCGTDNRQYQSQCYLTVSEGIHSHDKVRRFRHMISG